MSRTILLVKTGTAPPDVRARYGDFEHWFARGLGVPEAELLVADVTTGDALPDAREVAGVVVTGSPSMVSQPEPWTQPTADWLADAARRETAILGICYGHQLLAHGLGGRVGPNPNGREIGTIRVDVTAAIARRDPLLGDHGEELVVHASHSESVLALPEGAVPLGANDHDGHHAFAWGERAWGLQFHPEFEAEVMRGYLVQRAEELRDEGLDPEALHDTVEDSPHGDALLRRFRALVS